VTAQPSSANPSKWRRFFSRRDTPQPGPIVLDRPHIYILPTHSGFLFTLVLLVMLLGSMNYNNSMGYVLAFLLGSMAIVSILHTHRTLLGLRIEAGKVAPTFAGETAQFQLGLDNREHAARYALVWLRDPNIHTNWLRDSNLQKIKSKKFIIDLAADQRVSINIPVPTTQRGRVSLGRVTVYTRFPLGLFHAWSYVHLEASTLVYPQPRGHKTLRDYKPGDSPRHIDWKAVAREQDWMIKQFGGMSTTTVWLTWDDVSTLNNLEAALSQLCLWILVAENQGAEYGLKIPGSTLSPDSGEQHRERCLQALALFSS